MGGITLKTQKLKHLKRVRQPRSAIALSTYCPQICRNTHTSATGLYFTVQQEVTLRVTEDGLNSTSKTESHLCKRGQSGLATVFSPRYLPPVPLSNNGSHVGGTPSTSGAVQLHRKYCVQFYGSYNV